MRDSFEGSFQFALRRRHTMENIRLKFTRLPIFFLAHLIDL